MDGGMEELLNSIRPDEPHLAKPQERAYQPDLGYFRFHPCPACYQPPLQLIAARA